MSEQITITLPNGIKASDKWQDGQDTSGKFILLLVEMKPEVVKGVRKGKSADGTPTETPYEYTRIANVTDGRAGMYAGGKCYGADSKGHPVTFKTVGKLMPKPSDKASSPAVSMSMAV